MTRWSLGAGAVVLATALGGCGSTPPERDGLLGSESADPGPALVPNEHYFSLSQPVGKKFTDGFLVFRIDSDQPAVINSVRFVGADGMRMIGFKVADETRKTGFIQRLPWPPVARDLPPSSIKPGVGATVPANSTDGMSVELLLGVEITKPGLSVRKGLQVEYSIGDEEYSVYFPAGLHNCSTTEEFSDMEDCPDHGG